MTSATTESCPVNLPAIGSTVKVSIDTDTAHTKDDASDREKEGWAAMLAGAPKPINPEAWKTGGDDYTEDAEYVKGWFAAQHHKHMREAYDWKLEATELGDDGCWYAVLTRTEPNSLNDVYNGSGTGLGRHTITHRAKLT